MVMALRDRGLFMAPNNSSPAKSKIPEGGTRDPG